jgi:hypothetical protein
MKQNMPINVPYGFELVTDPDEEKQDGWIFIESGGDWLKANIRIPNVRGTIYAKPFMILEGYRLLPVSESTKNIEDQIWDAKIGWRFLQHICDDTIVHEDSAPVIRKIQTEPEVFWGTHQSSYTVPYYMSPSDFHIKWDTVYAWASKNDWVFKGFYLDKDTPMPQLYHPINMDTGEVAQWAKFVKKEGE